MVEFPPYNARRLGLVCLTVTGLALAAAIPLRCVAVALRVGGGSLLAGMGLGFCFVLVTRTRRPWLIYLALALGALTFVPYYQEWPPGNAWDVHPWRGAPSLFYNYLDVLRLLLYFVGIPWPFARFGNHAPDPIPDAPLPAGEFEEDSEKP